jgi:hypothetical protein
MGALSFEPLQDITKENVYTLRPGLVGLFVHYFSRSTYSTPPFDIMIGYENPSGINYIAMFLSIVIVVIICGCCSAACYKFSQILMKRRLRQRHNISHVAQNEVYNLNANNVNNQTNLIDEIKEKNITVLNELFSTRFKPRKYSDNINEFKIATCSICLENFDGTDVCVLDCKHIFHFKCIRDWLIKDSLKPKCPVCNDVILENINKNQQVSYYPVDSQVVVVRSNFGNI